MKEWIKKWWFSITMFVFALIVLIYGIVMLFLGEIELFFEGGVLATYAIMALFVLLIGLANAPQKEKRNEKN